MPVSSIIFFGIVFSVITFGIGFLLGREKKGWLIEITNQLPSLLFTVIYTDKNCTVLKEVGIKKRYFLVSTEVFGGKPIRPKDEVRKIKTDKERKDMGIPVLGYPPLVKDSVV